MLLELLTLFKKIALSIATLRSTPSWGTVAWITLFLSLKQAQLNPWMDRGWLSLVYLFIFISLLETYTKGQTATNMCTIDLNSAVNILCTSSTVHCGLSF